MTSAHMEDQELLVSKSYKEHFTYAQRAHTHVDDIVELSGTAAFLDWTN